MKKIREYYSQKLHPSVPLPLPFDKFRWIAFWHCLYTIVSMIIGEALLALGFFQSKTIMLDTTINHTAHVAHEHGTLALLWELLNNFYMSVIHAPLSETVTLVALPVVVVGYLYRRTNWRVFSPVGATIVGGAWFAFNHLSWNLSIALVMIPWGLVYAGLFVVISEQRSLISAYTRVCCVHMLSNFIFTMKTTALIILQ